MKNQPYESYKKSGVDWIREIPKAWNVKKIKWDTPVYRGASPRPIDDPKYFDDDGEYSWVRISDVTNSNGFLEHTEQRLSALGANLSVKLAPKDLFLSIAGTVGKPCISKIKCCIHDGFVYFPSLKVNRKYLYYIFLSGEPYKGLGKFGTQLNLNTDTVGSIKVPVPNESEQRSIAAFLDRETARVDALIDKKQQLIALLKEKRTALITRAVTKGLNPDVKMKDSGIEWLGEIPEHWEVFKIAHGFERIGSGTTPKSESSEYYEDGETAWVTTSELRENTIYETKSRITKKALQDYSTLKIYPKGTILIALYGATIGRMGILGIDATINQACCALEQPTVFNNHFVYYWLMASKPILLSYAFGGGQPNLSQQTIKNFKIVVPPIPEQNEIINYIENRVIKLEKLIKKNTIAIEKLREYRTALISAAVTGKIKVSDEN
jgi:type I restriction enzyme, S subunit